MLHADALGKTDEKKLDVPEFCIDAGSVGNIARFINHSCEPNLFVQCVLSSHHDIKLARILLFAADNIPPLQVMNWSSFSPSVSLLLIEYLVHAVVLVFHKLICRKRFEDSLFVEIDMIPKSDMTVFLRIAGLQVDSDSIVSKSSIPPTHLCG